MAGVQDHRASATEVADLDRARAHAEERAVAAVLGEPGRTAGGARAVAPLGLIAAVALADPAPHPPDRRLARGGRAQAVRARGLARGEVAAGQPDAGHRPPRAG